MRNYQHVIWDFNGTLMDDAPLCLNVMNEMLTERGLAPMSAARYAEIFDFPVSDYYIRAGWDPAAYAFEPLSDEFMAGYHANKLTCSLREGAVEVLAANHANGLPQSVISAAEQSMVRELVEHYQIGEYFISVRGLDNHHAAGKTAIGVAWVQELGIAPSTILMVGDTIHDHEVAEAMGVDCVLVYSGHQSHERLAATGAPVVDRLDEIEF
ncbi:MAG TPA: HAD family hydrolase [Anaerolineales bacterium]|nr:HAD family hydrolase [Anaerolineales bacterium]